MLYLGFPIWWALGLAQLIFFAMAAAMAVILRKQHTPLRVPRGFSALAAVPDLDAGRGLPGPRRGPGTVPGGGLGRVAGFSVRAGWYLAVTIAMLYVVNTARRFSTLRIVRLLGWMFVVTAGFGVLAVLVPTLEFESPVEMLLPGQLAQTNFIRTLVHPSLSSSSDFLGYVQPRPTAPFPYSNAWGNNIALYLPFFILAWFGRDAGWRRKRGPFVLVARDLPDHLLAQPGPVDLAGAGGRLRRRQAGRQRSRPGPPAPGRRAPRGRHRLRLLTALRHDRAARRDPAQQRPRAGTAETVISVTASGSPILGYGTTRTMQGSFASLAGGETADCHQCAAPPLGTQGFMWRLVLTTGFVGTACAWRSSPSSSSAEPGGRRRWTSRAARCCSTRCSASSSTTRSARRCSPR